MMINHWLYRITCEKYLPLISGFIFKRNADLMNIIDKKTGTASVVKSQIKDSIA